MTLNGQSVKLNPEGAFEGKLHLLNVSHQNSQLCGPFKFNMFSIAFQRLHATFILLLTSAQNSATSWASEPNSSLSPGCIRQVIRSQRRDPRYFLAAPSFLRKSALIPLCQSCILSIFLISSSDSEASPGSDGEGLAERTSCSFGSPAELAPGPCDQSPPASMEEIQVELQCADLWKRFHDIGTEMIITKAGR